MTTRFRGLSYFSIFARPQDWARCVDFYEKTVGFRLQYSDAGLRVAVFVFDNGTFLGVEHAEGDDHRAGVFTNVSVAVPDIAATHRELAAVGVAFVGPPEKQPWGGTLAHMRDPVGNVVTLVEYART